MVIESHQFTVVHGPVHGEEEEHHVGGLEACVGKGQTGLAILHDIYGVEGRTLLARKKLENFGMTICFGRRTFRLLSARHFCWRYLFVYNIWWRSKHDNRFSLLSSSKIY